MKRRLFAVLVLLSLVLSVASAGMWVRSTFAEDVWEFDPRPVGDTPGYYRHRMAGSVDGRVVWVEYAELNLSRGATIPGPYVLRIPSAPASMLNTPTLFRPKYGKATKFELPAGLLEWASAEQDFGRRWFLAVSWRLLVVLFALPAVLWVIRRIWLRHRHRVPAFPVLPVSPRPRRL